MAGTNRNISVRAVGDFSNLSQGLQRAQGQIQTFGDRVKSKFKEIGEVGLGLFEVFKVFQEIGEGVAELANRAAELDGGMSSLNRTLGQSAVDYMNWANSTATSFGISKMSAVEYGKSIAMLLGDVYTNQKQLTQATEQLMQGGAVIAAKTGKSQQEVYEDLNSALMGHAAAVKSLDINILNNALVHSQAYKQISNGAPWAKLTVAQQQYIRVTELNRQIQKKFGDTIGSGMDARMLLFKASLDNIKTALAEAFMPILYQVLPILTTFMNWIQTAISYVGAFFQTLFGYKGIQAGAAGAINQHAQAVNNLGNAYSNAGTKATKASKALSGGGSGGTKKSKTNSLNKGGTASFDQVHTLDNSSSSSAGSSGGSGGGGGGGGGSVPVIPTPVIPTPDTTKTQGALSKVTDSVRKFAEKFKQWLAPIKPYWDALISSVQGLWQSIVNLWNSQGVQAFVSWVSKAAQWIIEQDLSIFTQGIKLLSDAINVVADILNGNWSKAWNDTKKMFGDMISANNIYSNGLKSLWQNVLVPVGNFLTAVFKKAWSDIQTAMVSVNKNAIQPLSVYLKDLWKNVLSPIVSVVGDALKQAFDVLGKTVKDFWQYVMIPLANMLKTNFNPAVEAVSAVLKVLWKDVVAPVAKVIGVTLYEALKSAGNTFVWLYKNVIKPNMPLIKNIVDDTFRTIGGVINSLSGILNGVLRFITGVFTGNWRKAWSGLKEIIGSVFNGIWVVVKYPLNLIIDAVNSLIRGLDKIKFKIPNWVPIFGGQSYGINIPTIPHLAQGGITNGPMMAVIGDNPGGKEVVSPLDKLSGIISNTVMQAVQFANGGKSSNQLNGNVNVIVDGRTLARVIKPYLDLENKRVGTNVRLQSI